MSEFNFHETLNKGKISKLLFIIYKSDDLQELI